MHLHFAAFPSVLLSLDSAGVARDGPQVGHLDALRDGRFVVRYGGRHAVLRAQAVACAPDKLNPRRHPGTLTCLSVSGMAAVLWGPFAHLVEHVHHHVHTLLDVPGASALDRGDAHPPAGAKHSCAAVAVAGVAVAGVAAAAAVAVAAAVADEQVAVRLMQPVDPWAPLLVVLLAGATIRHATKRVAS